MTPMIVLVHGAWHGPWCWGPLAEELGDLRVETVDLPSAGPDPKALGDLNADVAAIKAVVSAIEGPVLVVAHSYGGAPTTQAGTELPNVVGIVYVAAFQIDAGDSLASAAGGAPPDWWAINEAEGYVDPLRPEEIFYGDVDAAQTAASIAKLTHHSLAAFVQPITAAAWHTVPSTYVICEQDQAIPLFAQEAMAQRAKRVVRMATAHSPFLSKPAELAGILRAELAAYS